MTHLTHLIRRFFWTLRARPLTPREQSEVEGLLRPTERSLFWGQPFVDQRHALDGAHRILTARPGDRQTARAALLHDVGKRHVGLGVIGRSLASGVRLLGFQPRWWQPYYDHGAVGAEELAAAGAEDLVVAWARHHSSSTPTPSIDGEQWAALKAADTA